MIKIRIQGLSYEEVKEASELIEVLNDKTKPAAFNSDTIIEDYWLSKSCEGVLCFHVQE